MPKSPLRASAIAAASCLALSATLIAAPAQAHRSPEPPVPSTVAEGLAGPLALGLGDRHELFVTQAFLGNLSKIDRRGRVSTVAQMPPGEPTPEGSSNEISGVDVSGGSTFHIETDYLAGFSHIVKTSARGKRSVVSRDFLAHEAKTNADGRVKYGFVGLKGQCASDLAALENQIGQHLVSESRGENFSHAYQLDVTRHATYVADAGANALLKVSPKSGKISTIAVLPPVKVTAGPELMGALNTVLAGMPQLPEGTTAPDCLLGKTFVGEPVPTDVEMGRDGQLYVTTLAGILGESLPLSHVYKVDPRHGKIRTVATGLHGTTGVAVASNGTVFAAEMFGGKVSVIKKGSQKATTLFTADSPGDVEVKGNTVYATTGVFDPEGNGKVVTVEYQQRGRR
ncbi:ScyD/ScyE family protein [Microbacterium sp. A93]|uniref:ScyD/ScyE family protein n=1 Tax=Microbacterium sp. A93 TaxID=3450716 RepID=UPI003F42CF5A